MVTTPSAPDLDNNPLIQEAEALNREDSDIVSEIESLDQAEAATAPLAPEPVAEVAPLPEVPQVPPAAPLGPETEAAALRRQIQEVQQRLQVYEAQEREQAIDREVTQYQAQLEAQGWDEPQAKTTAQLYKQSRQREAQIQQAAEAQNLNNLGKFYAALHYGQLHGIDPRELMQHNSPQAMESAAKSEAKIRLLEEQVKKLTQARVPPSSYETGQPAPAGGRSETAWMIAYNNGDRSPQALAAARKAAGL